jgi:hypothetical protein
MTLLRHTHTSTVLVGQNIRMLPHKLDYLDPSAILRLLPSSASSLGKRSIVLIHLKVLGAASVLLGPGR